MVCWGSDNLSVPLDLFCRANNLEWAFKDNLAPVDANSVWDFIKHIQTTTTVPIPEFDLNVRYLDYGTAERATIDIVKIRYRPEESSNNSLSDQRADVPTSAETIEYEFSRPFLKELHRQSWIRNRDASATRAGETYAKERLQLLEQEYAETFPGSGDDRDR